MRGTVGFCYFLIILQAFGWVEVTSRLLAPNNNHHHHHIRLSGTELTPESQQIHSSRVKDQMKQEEMYKGVNKKLGSSPPSCEHKCYGCMPCEPTQVPTDTSQVGLQYTNYEPEGWKCKCGPSFYSP